MKDFFTKKGKETIKKAKEKGLYKFYDEFSGCFVFSDSDIDDNINSIVEWLKENQDYMLSYQDEYYVLAPQDL